MTTKLIDPSKYKMGIPEENDKQLKSTMNTREKAYALDIAGPRYNCCNADMLSYLELQSFPYLKYLGVSQAH
jgi:hypothetical protein